ncbi:MAG: tetratricopeptide repeat protein [Thermodesulfobacteriota bacterium]
MTKRSDPYKFLLLDTDHQFLHTLQDYLREMGFTDILTARSAVEGWSKIKHLAVEAVISAWDLPEMSGLVLLKIMRTDTAHAHTPFIIMVEEVTKTQVIEAGEAGVTEILTRPFSKETFILKVNQALYPEEDAEAVEFQRFYDRGVALMNESRYVEALDMLEKCLTIYESADIYYNLGYIKTTQLKYEEALAAFRKATQIDKDHARAYHMMSVVYAKLGRTEESQAYLDRAVAIYAEKKMDEEAEKVLRQALEFNPDTINVFNSLGIYYRRQGRYAEAKRYYLRALKVTPHDEHIYYNLARVYAEEGDNLESRRALKKALEIRPDFDQARELLRQIEIN